MSLLFSNEIYYIKHMWLISQWVCSEGPEGQQKSTQKNEFTLMARAHKLQKEKKVMKINFSLRFFKSVKKRKLQTDLSL